MINRLLAKVVTEVKTHAGGGKFMTYEPVKDLKPELLKYLHGVRPDSLLEILNFL